MALRAQMKKTGEPVFLFIPKNQNWDRHFEIVGTMIQGKTFEGHLTVRLLQLNHPDRLKSRELYC